jgi:hypothetical protein
LTLPPPPAADAQLARALRAALDESDYAPAPFAAAVKGEHDAAALRLFGRGERLPLVDAPFDVDGAVALGVVRVVGDELEPTVRIVPHDILLLASDLPSASPPPEHVAAAHEPSLTLARLTVRRQVERALDLGTGNGVQALLLASHANTVVATDANERALRFTELNAALNGRTNIETRAGDWLEPVAGDRFDCIVCSPPYVISPESDLLYRNASVRGDVLSEQLVRDLPELLASGGFATVLVSWAAQADEPEPPAWAPDDVSSLLIRLHHEPAEATAEYWQADAAGWVDYYRSEGIETISYGAVVLHRGAGTPWRDWVDLPGGPRGVAGAQLERIFAAHEAPPPARYGWAPEARIDRSSGAVSLEPGLGLAVELPAELLAAVESRAAPPEVVADLWSLGFLVARD